MTFPEPTREQRIAWLEEAHYREDTAAVLEHVNRALAERPLYRRLGYPRSIASLTEMQRLPLLDKAVLRSARPSELVAPGVAVAEALREERLFEWRTSGSHEQVAVWVAPGDGGFMPLANGILMNVADAAIDHVAMLTSPLCSGTSCPASTDGSYVLIAPTADVFAEPDAYFERVARQLSALPDSVLMTNPVLLHQVLRRCEALGLTLRLRGAVASSYQRLSRPQRRAIEAALGVRAFEHYGATELGGCVVANGCAADAPHVWSSQVYVEIVDEDGAALPHGREGRVVVTTLAAHGTALVRYAVGDLGVLTQGPCACGLANAKTLRILGRRADAWRRGDAWVTESVFDERLADVSGIDFFQVTLQRSGGLRAVVVPREVGAVAHGDVVAALAGLADGPTTVVESDRIFVSSGQKYPLLRNWSRALA